MTELLQDLEFLRELEDMAGWATEGILLGMRQLAIEQATAFPGTEAATQYDEKCALLRQRLNKARATETRILRMIEEAKA